MKHGGVEAREVAYYKESGEDADGCSLRLAFPRWRHDDGWHSSS